MAAGRARGVLVADGRPAVGAVVGVAVTVALVAAGRVMVATGVGAPVPGDAVGLRLTALATGVGRAVGAGTGPLRSRLGEGVTVAGGRGGPIGFVAGTD